MRYYCNDCDSFFDKQEAKEPFEYFDFVLPEEHTKESLSMFKCPICGCDDIEDAPECYLCFKDKREIEGDYFGGIIVPTHSKAVNQKFICSECQEVIWKRFLETFDMLFLDYEKEVILENLCGEKFSEFADMIEGKKYKE